MGPFCDMGPLGFQHTLAVNLAFPPWGDVLVSLACGCSRAGRVDAPCQCGVWRGNHPNFLALGGVGHSCISELLGPIARSISFP